MAHGMKFSPKTLSKSKHGLAYVSNVDGRGIFSVCGIFKRGEKASTSIYDLVNILCYVGGEIRDGFFVEKLREHELVPMLERNFSMAAGKAIFQPAPIEEAAKLLVLPCYEKAKAGGVVDLFVNREVKRSFEFFERVSQLCAYSDEEDFILAKGGSQIKKPFVYFDLQRPEFNAWWMEKSELEQQECSLPPVPMKFPEPGKLLLDGDSMIDFMSAASNERSKILTWKKKTLEKLSTAVNFDRLCGMSRHQALWYTWKGDLKMGITMLDSAKKIRDDQNAGRMLNSKVPVVDLFVALTQIKLEKMGQCEGQSNDECFLGTRTCLYVDKKEKVKIGTENTRKSLIAALAVVRNVKSKEEFKTCIKYNLKGSLEVFLEHSFASLYWKNKPTLPMTEALIEEAVIEFVNAIDCDNFDPYDWAETCATILEEMMARYCCTKLSGKDISEVGQLFKEAFKTQVVQKIQKIEELPQYSSFCDDRVSLHQLSSVMAARAIAPSVASHFLFTWKTMTPTEKKKKALTISFNDLLAATKKVYDSYSKKGVALCIIEDPSSSEACPKKECACEELAKFQDHIIDLLSSKHNPVSFLSCSPEGTVSLSEDLITDNSGQLINDIIVSCDMYMYEKIMDSDNLKEFSNCPRLACLCQFACCEMYTMLKVKLVMYFKEISWKESAEFETRCCAFCKQMVTEGVTLKKCSACKAVVYCSCQCQKKDWKAGHKQICHILRRP